MDTFLQRLGLSQQIAFVGMLGVIGLIVVGGIYGLGNARQMTAQQRVDRANESIDALDAIKIDLLEARRSEKDFLLRRKDEYADKQNAAVAAASKDLKILRRLVDPQNQAAVDRAVAQVGRYADQFSAVSKIAHTVGLDENSGLEGTLRGSVHGIEELLGGGTVSQISDANAHLNAAMLMMRRHEKDFFARLRPTYLDQMKKAAEDFQQILGQSSMPSDQKSEVTQKLASYQRDFSAAAAGSFSQVDAVAQLSTTYAEAQPILDAMEKQVKETAAASTDDSRQIIANTSQMIYWGIGIVIVVAGILAWIVSRGVTTMLGAMSRLMERLRQGRPSNHRGRCGAKGCHWQSRAVARGFPRKCHHGAPPRSRAAGGAIEKGETAKSYRRLHYQFRPLHSGNARRLEQRCHRHADNRPGNVGNGRGDEPAGDGGCLGFGGSIRQCPIGRVGRGRIIEHGCRNHPAGLAIRRCRTQGSR
jgi:CHASE3 domain sensor protein